MEGTISHRISSQLEANLFLKVTVGAVNDNADRYSEAYRRQFVRANVPVKKHLGSFLVSIHNTFLFFFFLPNALINSCLED